MSRVLDNSQQEQIAERLAGIRENIARAAAASGRNAADVEILTVTKRQPMALVRAAYACGLRVFGENYAQELLEKIEGLPDLTDIHWDMIGHVQSRKAKLIADQVRCVQSLDSEKLAVLLDANRSTGLPPLEVLLEVNVSGEDSKAGVDASREADWPRLLPLVSAIHALPRLRLTGLMTMPPLQENMEANRPYFRKLAQLRDFFNGAYEGLNITALSMGTSSDYPVAVEEGATIIRLGEALLGPRTAKE